MKKKVLEQLLYTSDVEKKWWWGWYKVEISEEVQEEITEENEINLDTNQEEQNG